MNHIDVTAFHGKVYRSNFPPSRLIIAALSIMPLPPFKRSGASVSPATISMITWLRFHGNRGLVPSVRLALPDLLYVCARLADMLICVCVCVCVCLWVCVWDNIQGDAAGGHYAWEVPGTVYYVPQGRKPTYTHAHAHARARTHTHTDTHTHTHRHKRGQRAWLLNCFL